MLPHVETDCCHEGNDHLFLVSLLQWKTFIYTKMETSRYINTRRLVSSWTHILLEFCQFMTKVYKRNRLNRIKRMLQSVWLTQRQKFLELCVKSVLFLNLILIVLISISTLYTAALMASITVFDGQIWGDNELLQADLQSKYKIWTESSAGWLTQKHRAQNKLGTWTSSEWIREKQSVIWVNLLLHSCRPQKEDDTWRLWTAESVSFSQTLWEEMTDGDGWKTSEHKERGQNKLRDRGGAQ